jgi:4-amino-4-deoxy-L-arabinose transferase-like glycosyltransferase
MRWAEASRYMLAVLLLAVFARAVAMAALAHNLAKDPDGYGRLAENLVTHKEYAFYPGAPTAFRPPLYPLLLTTAVAQGRVQPWRVAVLHLVCGVVCVGSTFLLAREFQLSQRRSAVAAALVAINPLLLYQSSYVMTETLATCLATTACWQAVRFYRTNQATSGLGTGVLFGLSVLCRPTFLVWSLLLIGFFLVRATLQARSVRLWPTVMLALGFLSCVCGWWIRNYGQFHQLILTTTHGGYTLWLANNDLFYDWLLKARPSSGAPWSAEDLDRQYATLARACGYQEPVVDQQAYHRAWQTIVNRPGAAMWASLYRLGQFWRITPQETTGRHIPFWSELAVAGFYLAEYVLVLLVGIQTLRRRTFNAASLPPLLLVVTLSVIHSVYWSNARMRAPIEPVLAVAACAFHLPIGSRRPSTLKRAKHSV